MGLTTELDQVEKRKRIALASGWQESRVSQNHPEWVTAPGESPDLCGGPAECNVPEYFTSLEDMHQAEMYLLDNEQKHRYASLLGRHDYWTLIHATATQRAEAFGKALNLW